MENNTEFQEFQELHMVVNFQIRSYSVSPASTAFRKWFEQVFKKTNPTAADNFDFTDSEDEGEPVLEVMAHLPDVLGIDSLEALWQTYLLDLASLKTPKPIDLQGGIN